MEEIREPFFGNFIEELPNGMKITFLPKDYYWYLLFALMILSFFLFCQILFILFFYCNSLLLALFLTSFCYASPSIKLTKMTLLQIFLGLFTFFNMISLTLANEDGSLDLDLSSDIPLAVLPFILCTISFGFFASFFYFYQIPDQNSILLVGLFLLSASVTFFFVKDLRMWDYFLHYGYAIYFFILKLLHQYKKPHYYAVLQIPVEKEDGKPHLTTDYNRLVDEFKMASYPIEKESNNAFSESKIWLLVREYLYESILELKFRTKSVTMLTKSQRNLTLSWKNFFHLLDLQTNQQKNNLSFSKEVFSQQSMYELKGLQTWVTLRGKTLKWGWKNKQIKLLKRFLK